MSRASNDVRKLARFRSPTLLQQSKNTNHAYRMREEAERPVVVRLTVDEAYELLNACLQHAGEDTPLFRDALRRLAWAIEAKREEDTAHVA